MQGALEKAASEGFHMSEEIRIGADGIDKSQWGDGPWQGEPDRVEFKHAGLPCLMTRHPEHGNWCGYAAVPPGHPLHGASPDNANLGAHGGVNYASLCSGLICHVPDPGEPDDVWWFGFDCAHSYDYCPGLVATLRKLHVDPQGLSLSDCAPLDEEILFGHCVYRDLAYVRGQVECLAEQLAEAA